MPSLGRKYSVLEEYGVEFQWDVERIPNAEDIAIVTDTTNTLVGADLQDVLNKLNLPAASQLPTYSSGLLTNMVMYSSSSQVTANRIANVAITYTSGFPTSEVWTLYSSADGTTVLKTFTITNTWTSGVLTNTTTATS